MAAKRVKKQTSNKQAPRKRSKRDRRLRLVIYIMIIAMVLSSLTTGLIMFI